MDLADEKLLATRRSMWGSLASRLKLEGACEDEDDEDENDKIAPGISPNEDGARFNSSAITGEHYFGFEEEFDKTSDVQPFSSNPSTRSRQWRYVHSSVAAADEGKALYLDDWIAHHIQISESNGIEPAKQREYLAKSTKLLSSLVGNIVGGDGITRGGDANDVFIHPNFIVSKNILVRESMIMGSEEVTADFVKCGDSIFCNDSMDETKKKFAAMEALGNVAYELFMSGRGPKVHDLTSSKASSMQDQVTEGTHLDEEGEIIDMLRKSSRRTISEGRDISGIASTMMDAGLPYPLCRLVSDLLGNGDGKLGRAEHTFSSFQDVLSDLQQMIDDPDSFLHGSSPDRWKLLFGDKLYGREKDMQVLIDAADRVATTSNDPIFEQLTALTGKRKEVVMISGNSGSGKSHLARSIGAHLGGKGWIFLRSKFDPVAHPEPLSILAFAFEEYLGSIIGRSERKKESASRDDISPLSAVSERTCLAPQVSLPEIRHRLETIVGRKGLTILAKHIPSIRLVFESPLPEDIAMEVNETMMHTLFGQLLQALSSGGNPILFFLDDLQWADPLSLAVLFALVKGARPDLLHLSSVDSDNHTSRADVVKDTHVLFVGSYRDNEVGNNHELAGVLGKFQSESSINMTNITLSGLTSETLNDMLAGCLSLPIRRVRSLSELIITKTDGQPLHVIEFIRAMTMENLLTHSFATGWEWDSDSIEIFPITESVAELLALKLKRLPHDICLGLQIISCFGSQIDSHVLELVADYDGETSVDIPAAISVALGEGLMEQAAHFVRFAHDLIQKAVLDSIDPDSLVPLLRKLSAALIKNASAVGELDSVLFVAVDLTNRIGRSADSSPKERAMSAELNLRAGIKAINVPDFAGAASYAENGISFLGDNHWEMQYDLSLNLYELSVSSHISSPSHGRDHLRKRIDAVFENARDFSDKFTTHSAWIKFLCMGNLSRAVEESLNALKLLGEPLDLEHVDRSTVLRELAILKEQYPGDSTKESLWTQRLSDHSKIRAMKIMSSLAVYYRYQRSPVLALFVSCRMIKISIDFGHCEESVCGAAALAASLVFMLEDVEEACAWARAALSLTKAYGKDSLIPYVNASVYGAVFFWTEPLQSTTQPLAEGIKLALTSGDIESAALNTGLYTSRSFLCGKKVSVLLREVIALAHQHGIPLDDKSSSQRPEYPRLLQEYLMPLYTVLCSLGRGKDPPENEEGDQIPLSDNTDVLKAALKAKRMSWQVILMYEIFNFLVFRDMKNALAHANIFSENFATEAMPMRFASAYNLLFEALVTFHFMRQTGNKSYLVRGENALLKLNAWSIHSNWNFKNKLLLAEAELYNTRKDFDKAASCYEAAVEAAQEHRFVHEEAIASELSGIFFFERGLYPRAHKFLIRSIKCYEKWGAHAVARRVEDSIREKFDSSHVKLCLSDAYMEPMAPTQLSNKRHLNS